MSSSLSALAGELANLRYDFDSGATARKLVIWRTLARTKLPSPESVRAFHESLCFARAFPETAEVRAMADLLLESFHERADVRRFRKSLADTGIAGTPIHFRFYWLTAIWLIRQGLGRHLSVDWKEWERQERIDGLWHLLLPFAETPALDTFGFRAREWVRRLKGPEESDAEFLIRRFDALPVPGPVKECLYEDLDIPMILSPGPRTPARSREVTDALPVVFQRKPPQPGRPRLREAIRSAELRVRAVPPREGRRWIDLANSCMVTRHRDLLVFLNADERDVRLIDCGDGLVFACMGAVPERRLLLEAVYGLLTIKNGVPIGYVLTSAFYRSAEVAYNVFETFRGRGAAHVYANVLALVHRLFGADTFAVDPYQLGHGNEEGQKSGAWWFYYKLGFRPHDPEVKALVRTELGRMKKDRRYRTPPAGIDRLAAAYMYLHMGRSRRDVLGHLPLGEMGLAASGHLSSRFGADRERGVRVSAREAAEALGVRLRSLAPGERLAWDRWAPLVLAMRADRWTTAQRTALAAVIRAKGGRRESEYVTLFDRHRKLQASLLELAREQASHRVP